MSLDIVCYYADFGFPYLPLLRQMTASAKAVMPEATTVLLTPTPSPELGACFDEMCALPGPITRDRLSLERGRAVVSWMLAAKRRAVFVDPDIVFRRPVVFDDTWDVGMLWRDKPDQPVNAGMLFAAPGQPDFWRLYGHVIVNLPGRLHHWWSDQLALSLLTGVCRAPGDRLVIEDARVLLMDAKCVCTIPGEVHDDAWAVHHKGALKGAEWKAIFDQLV